MNVCSRQKWFADGFVPAGWLVLAPHTVDSPSHAMRFNSGGQKTANHTRYTESARLEKMALKIENLI